MPTKNVSTINIDGATKIVNILNAIRDNSSLEYQNRVPEATQDNIAEIGQAVTSYHATANEFLNALVNRIARVIITSKMYTNPLKMFKKGLLEYGETVEELFVNIARAHDFNPAVAENEVFKREIPEVLSAFHKRNSQQFYKATVSEEQLRTAFLSAQGVSDLISRIVDSMYTGSEFDEFITMKELIRTWAYDGKFYTVEVPEVNATNMKSIVSTIKGVSNKMEFMNSIYNPYGVATFTKKNKQVLITSAEFDAIMDVEVLASAFNMSKAEFMGRRVMIDEFTGMDGVVAILVDEDFFMVFDNMIQFTEQYNGQGLYWNYFLHVWKTYSISPFANAVLFVSDVEPSVNDITVTTKYGCGVQGANIPVSVNVTTTGYASKDVRFELEGLSGADTVELSEKTVMNGNVLHIGEDETAEKISIVAISTFDEDVESDANEIKVLSSGVDES